MIEPLKTGIILAITLIVNQNINAQEFKDLDNIQHDISYLRESRISKPLVKVIYGRPQKQGQDVFGNLVTYGQIWRTGANEATEVKFYQDTYFGDIKVLAGTYVLYTIPREKEWEIILSSNLDVLGAFQYDSDYDIARIVVPSSKAEELESFSIAFKQQKNNIQMVLAWDTTRVKIPLSLNNRVDYAKL